MFDLIEVCNTCIMFKQRSLYPTIIEKVSGVDCSIHFTNKKNIKNNEEFFRLIH
jgi:hypothetical protein